MPKGLLLFLLACRIIPISLGNCSFSFQHYQTMDYIAGNISKDLERQDTVTDFFHAKQDFRQSSTYLSETCEETKKMYLILQRQCTKLSYLEQWIDSSILATELEVCFVFSFSFTHFLTAKTNESFLCKTSSRNVAKSTHSTSKSHRNYHSPRWTYGRDALWDIFRMPLLLTCYKPFLPFFHDL